MQEQTPIRNRKKPVSKRKAAAKARPAHPKAKNVTVNNPYQRVPVQSNNRPGFTFGGSVS